MGTKRRLYSKEFKVEAVELAEKIGISKASIDLGVNQANITRWRRAKNTPEPSIGSKAYADLEKQLRLAQKENQYLKKISDVLKKSLGIFSADHIQNTR